MITLYTLNQSRSQRIAWLLEELGVEAPEHIRKAMYEASQKEAAEADAKADAAKDSDVVDADLAVKDSKGRPALLKRVFEPRKAIIGAKAIEAHRHVPPGGPASRIACPNCGWLI